MIRALPFLLLFVCVAAPGQRPKPIEIPLREGSGLAHGRLRARQQIEYQVSASGQALNVSLASIPVRTLQVRVYAPDGDPAPIQRESPGHWTVATPRPGVYGITVMRTTRSAPASRFTLRVAIE